MVERQDIDALLISALYGELTPSQESELTAHLASHPADKAALEGLTLTRDQVRSSRILAVQVEPPQSVSALLIQEAARRAPKAPSEGEGWFARFVRSFVQHPAMAAAAMLVLVVGIAAVVGRKNGNQFANEAADRTLAAPTAAMNDKTGQPTEGGAAGSSMEPQVAQSAAPAGAAGSGSAANGYIDTGAARDEATGKDLTPDTNAVRAGDRVGMPVTLAEEHQGSKIATADGIVLDRRAHGPKDLADEKAPEKESLRYRADQQKAKNQADDAWGKDGDLAKGTGNAEQPVATKAPSVGGGAAAAPPPPPAPPASLQYASPPPPRTPTTATRPTVSATQGVPASTVPTPSAPVTAPAPQNAPATSMHAPGSPAPAPAEPPKPEPKKKESEAKKVDPKPADKVETKALEQREMPKADKAEASKAEAPKADPTVDWAKAQHAVLVTKARNGECAAAADLAVVIEGRAPSYFAANIANDRDLKTCQATITAAREKEAEKRASVERAKKAGSASEPKAAKKADAPKATTTTDSK